MPRPWIRHAIAAVLTALSATLVAVGGLTMGTAGAATPVRIMPLGDSITAGPGCWRSYLWNNLQSNGYTDIDFVGTQPGGGCSLPFDGDHEGHGGYQAYNIAAQSQLPPWLAATRPDVVLMHLGTNDVWNNRPVADILGAFSTLVRQMRESNPSMKILVAQIIPMNPSGCADCGQRVVNLNQAIPGWAAGLSTAQSPVVVVDQWTGFSTAADTNDGVHPIDSGERKMAAKWYPPLVEFLTKGTPTATPTTPTSTPTSHPTGSCTAAYRIVNQWQGGFQGEVTVTNTGTRASTGWTAQLTLGSGQQISQVWSGVHTQSGTQVTVHNASWNGALGPNAATTFGFIASSTSTATATPATCTTS